MDYDKIIGKVEIDMDKLKENYGQVAETNIRAELILNELITLEKISVPDDEVEKAVKRGVAIFLKCVNGRALPISRTISGRKIKA